VQEERPLLRIVEPDDDPLPPSRSPAQSNASTVGSFLPLGETASGTIHISDCVENVHAVRVYCASGKIRFLRYRLGSKKWETR
jgi:hypothetical protein